MKKYVISFSGLALGLVVLAGGTTKASATTVTDDATASFKLVAPTETLKITNATDFTFEDGVISADDIVTTNSADAVVAIQELSGNAPGWQLSAKLGNFTGTTNGKTLTGAQLFYPSVTPTTTTAGDASGILPVSVATDTAFSGTDKGKILTAGSDAANIVTADAGKGYGSWTMTYPKNKLQLKVPAGNLQDTYTATLTYSLTDTPVATTPAP